MTAVAFDTLKFARSLREKAKLSPEQAEGMADAMSEALQGDIATKVDIGDVRKAIEALRLSVKADIEASKAEIMKWMFGTVGFQTLLIIGAVIVLARNLH